MKKLSGIILIFGVLIIMAGCVTNKNTTNTSTTESITEESTALELDAFLSLQKELDGVIIDIRTPDEIANGKLTENALEIDYYSSTFLEEIKKLDTEKAYFIYCAHGNRTRYAKDIMNQFRFRTVYDLKDGISVLE